MILHVDMDAFFASIEQTANPKLKGKPLIVGARGNRLHTVVCAASYEAKAYGIDSGMPCKEAFKLCPKAQFVAADSAKYIYASREIFEILKEFSPNTECASVDEFILDLSGLEAILGPLETIAKNIKNRIKERFNITCSIGISTTRTLAKLGSGLNKPDGLTLIQESNLQDILQATPVEKLCGVGSSLKEHLNSLKIYTCQDLFNIPESILSEKFGKVGLWLYDAVRLIEDSPVMASECPKLPPKSIGHSYTLPKPISEKQAIFGWIRLLSEMVGQRLRHKISRQKPPI